MRSCLDTDIDPKLRSDKEKCVAISLKWLCLSVGKFQAFVLF